jgi:hypothetical protein
MAPRLPKRGHLGGVMRPGGSYRAIDDNAFVNPYGGGRSRVKFTGDPMKDTNIVGGRGDKLRDWTTNPVTGKRTMSGAEYDRYDRASTLRANQIIGPTIGQVRTENERTRLPSSRMVSTGGYTYDLGLSNTKTPGNVKKRGR